MGGEVVEGYTEVIESVGYTVGETAHDEEGYAEYQGKKLVLTGKLHGGGHDETAADAQHAATQGTEGEPAFQDALCRVLQGKGTATHHESHQGATHEVEEEDNEKGTYLALADETSRASVEFEGIVDHGGQSKGKEDGTYDVLA